MEDGEICTEDEAVSPVERDSDPEFDDESEYEDSGCSLFDALAAAQEAQRKYQESLGLTTDGTVVDENDRLEEDFFVTTFTDCIRLRINEDNKEEKVILHNHHPSFFGSDHFMKLFYPNFTSCCQFPC